MQYLLAFDTETSGLVYGSKDPSFNHDTNEHYQIVSIGMLVLDAKSLRTVEKLYLEIQWNGESLWAQGAEAVHGLSKSHLEEFGLTEEEACDEIMDFITKYWGPEDTATYNDVQKFKFPCAQLNCVGHNVHFDIAFLRGLFNRVCTSNLVLNISQRNIDSFALGYTILGAENSDELFEMCGLPERTKHNSLEDIEYTVESIRRIKKLAA